MKRAAPDAAGSNVHADVPANLKNGGRSPVEQGISSSNLSVILASLQAMRHGDFSVRLPGTWTGLEGKVADTFNEIVSANQQLARELAERTKLLKLDADLLELATEAVIVRNWDGRVEFWNSGAEATFGWSREEMLGRDLHQILQTKFPVSQQEVTATLVKSGHWAGNLTQATKGGDEITLATRKVVRFDDGGMPVSVLETGRDITAQLQTEAALRNSERLAAMGRMAGIIAHEINNPLEAITNALFLLRDHPSLDDQARHYAEMADQELLRVSRITSQTLGFYREPQEPIPVKISELLNDILELQQRRLQLMGVNVERNYRAEGQISGFPAELKQVFLNILHNAIQSMPEGGRLRVSVFDSISKATGRKGVRVSICDTGSGIRPEHAKRLFEPFFSTKKEKGTGLGLWISKGIITKYEGTIAFRSLRREGRSVTCFSIFIPGAVAGRPVIGIAPRKVQEAIGSP